MKCDNASMSKGAMPLFYFLFKPSLRIFYFFISLFSSPVFVFVPVMYCYSWILY